MSAQTPPMPLPPSPNSNVETLTPKAMVLGSGAFWRRSVLIPYKWDESDAFIQRTPETLPLLMGGHGEVPQQRVLTKAHCWFPGPAPPASRMGDMNVQCLQTTPRIWYLATAAKMDQHCASRVGKRSSWNANTKQQFPCPVGPPSLQAVPQDLTLHPSPATKTHLRKAGTMRS